MKINSCQFIISVLIAPMLFTVYLVISTMDSDNLASATTSDGTKLKGKHLYDFQSR